MRPLSLGAAAGGEPALLVASPLFLHSLQPLLKLPQSLRLLPLRRQALLNELQEQWHGPPFAHSLSFALMHPLPHPPLHFLLDCLVPLLAGPLLRGASLSFSSLGQLSQRGLLSSPVGFRDLPKVPSLQLKTLALVLHRFVLTW